MRQGTATALCSHLIHGQVSAAVGLFSWEKRLCVPSPFPQRGWDCCWSLGGSGTAPTLPWKLSSATWES